MYLNREYYQSLIDKYANVQVLPFKCDDKSIYLTLRMVIDRYKQNKLLHINLQNSKESIFSLANRLFIELANDIYLNHYDLPAIMLGSRLRDKRKHSDGKVHDYLIKKIVSNTYTLEDLKNKSEINISYDSLIKKFFPLEQGAKDKTIQSYIRFFSEINGELNLEFTPATFEKKLIFIAKRPLWDNLAERNKIPAIYLPNPREENHSNEIKSIPALSDCLIYFTPKYEVCYQQVISKGEKIKAVIVFDTEADKVDQMLQDRAVFGFNLIILTNSHCPTKNSTIPFWNWYKEEIDIVNAL